MPNLEAAKLHSVISDDLFPKGENISEVKKVIYELKGVVYSVETLMSNDIDVDYGLIERIQSLVNQAVEIIEK